MITYVVTVIIIIIIIIITIITILLVCMWTKRGPLILKRHWSRSWKGRACLEPWPLCAPGKSAGPKLASQNTYSQFSKSKFARFQIEGLKSQYHRLCLLQNTLLKFKSPRVWAHFSRLNFWKLAVVHLWEGWVVVIMPFVKELQRDILAKLLDYAKCESKTQWFLYLRKHAPNIFTFPANQVRQTFG